MKEKEEDKRRQRRKNGFRIFVELFFEAIVDLALLVIGYFGLMFVFIAISDQVYPSIVEKKPYVALMYPRYQRYFALGFTIFYLVLGAVIVILRIRRRYQRIQLGYILDDLHYISEGHYDYRISNRNMKSMTPIIESINRLVDSTVQAMDEERQIEQSKDELIANMSHDIRTPLTSIIGYLGLLKEGQFEDKEQGQYYATIAYNKSLQMQKMVEDLFEYTKVSQVNTEMDIQKVNLKRLMEQLIVEFEVDAEEVGREMQLDCPQDEIWVDIDSEKIVRVFSNLISNAFKYGGEGKYVRLSARQDQEKVTCTVSDDGNEIPEEDLDNLFQRFYRGDKSRTTKGSGLGLAIAQSIVRLHHGRIWAESGNGETRFIFTLPNHYEKSKNEEGEADADA